MSNVNDPLQDSAPSYDVTNSGQDRLGDTISAPRTPKMTGKFLPPRTVGRFLKSKHSACTSPSQKSVCSDWSDAEEYVIAYQDDISEPTSSPRRNAPFLANQSLALRPVSGTSRINTVDRKHTPLGDEISEKTPGRVSSGDTSDCSETASEDSSWTGVDEADWHDSRQQAA